MDRSTRTSLVVIARAPRAVARTDRHPQVTHVEVARAASRVAPRLVAVGRVGPVVTRNGPPIRRRCLRRCRRRRHHRFVVRPVIEQARAKRARGGRSHRATASGSPRRDVAIVASLLSSPPIANVAIALS